MPTFAVLVVTLLLLTFMGDALRDALDTRKGCMDAISTAPCSKSRTCAWTSALHASSIDVSSRDRRGEKFALVGESGSGKTVTALSILRLLDAAT